MIFYSRWHTAVKLCLLMVLILYKENISVLICFSNVVFFINFLKLFLNDIPSYMVNIWKKTNGKKEGNVLFNDAHFIYGYMASNDKWKNHFYL